MAGQEYTTVLRCNLDAEVAARNITLNVDALRIVVAVAARIDVTRSRRLGRTGDNAHLSAFDTTVYDDGYSNRPNDLKERDYQGDMAFHS